MADIKKFLDQGGVTHLWQKINLALADKADGSDLEALTGRVGANETAISNLQSADTALSDRIDELEGFVEDYEPYDDTALASRVTANENAITLLNKTDGTVGSVKKTVDDAIAAIVASAPADFDTLKEISDWISGHASDASAMNSDIAELKRLTGGLGTTGDPAAAKTVKQYVDDAIAGLSIGDYARAADLQALAARVTALENLGITAAKVSAWDAAEQNAKDYADSLASNYDVAGAAATAEQNAKDYADDIYDAIQSLSNAEIDAAIAAANNA